MKVNFKCDGWTHSFCAHNEEVRIVPMLHNGESANLCFRHFCVEIKCRQQENQHLPVNEREPLPRWKDLPLLLPH